ncbi:MAG: hypothetical protein H7Y04_13970 [Verrucomicrobia bacterium]|nr:hypothetical protein [Cytophagales bacterium]
MKNLLLIFILMFSFFNLKAQSKSTKFKTLLSTFSALAPGASVLLPLAGKGINDRLDAALAHEILLDKNPLFAPEKFKTYPVGYFNRSENVAVLVFAKESFDIPGYFAVDVRTYDIKKGKLINMFANWGEFDLKSEKTCTVFVMENKGLVRLINNSSYGEQSKNIVIQEDGKMIFSK